MHIYYKTVRGSTIIIIGFAMWPDLPKTQLLNNAIKTHPMLYVQVAYSPKYDVIQGWGEHKNHSEAMLEPGRRY